MYWPKSSLAALMTSSARCKSRPKVEPTTPLGRIVTCGERLGYSQLHGPNRLCINAGYHGSTLAFQSIIIMAPAQGGFSWSNIAVGAVMNMFEVTTLGQPLEVIKTQMASNRTQTMFEALKTVWSRGGPLGFYQGLIPWAWIEASTKGAVLLFTSSEVQSVAKSFGMGPGAAGLLGGMTGGIVQAYATMGFCTCMKTAEITRARQAATGVNPPSTWQVFADIYRREGIRGINKGVNAVAVRQMTNWGSRYVWLPSTSLIRPVWALLVLLKRLFVN